MARGKKKSTPEPKRGRGRLPSLTPEVHKALVEATREGLPRKTVADVCGIGRTTFLNYLAKGRKQSKGIYKDLLDDVQKARGQAVKRNVLVIQNAALGKVVTERRTIRHPDGSTETVEKFAPAQWTAAAWWLERCESDEFGRKDQTTHRLDGKKAKAAQLVLVEGPDRIEPPDDRP